MFSFPKSFFSQPENSLLTVLWREVMTGSSQISSGRIKSWEARAQSLGIKTPQVSVAGSRI